MITYYAYILINSLTSQPFYIGKGSGSRMYQHIRDARRNDISKRSVHCTISSILAKGGDVLYEKILCKSETAAFNKEKELIVKYGRKDIGTGVLCNLTEGARGHT